MHGVVAIVTIGLVVVLVAFGAVAWSRTHTLDRRVGSFRCAVNRRGEGHWSPGVAQYGAEHLYWWRRHSLAPRPRLRWDRRALSVVSRVPEGADVVVTCSAAGRSWSLLMSPEAYAGLTSWLEATPSRVGTVI
ncbi:DUF2550 domain-containing protein [Cellulomonas sp. HZM]|uniref:DUF2550 domain-containing protein n=1 Tax=Cellulomonas sp. HZM TaxID=1454010 RepID=UPI000493567A|nr:DUF2550 domain-containing protein [Cellulomonas sp. HZM]